MSRTLNTMPYDRQVELRESWRSADKGYPKAYGGAWPGRKSRARIRNRKYRRAATIALAQEKEIPEVKRNVAYDIW